MSLINDALKRAKQAQQPQPTPPSFREAPLHVAPAPHSSHLWPMALGALGLAVIMAVVVVWYSIRHQPASIPSEVNLAPAGVVKKSLTVESSPQALIVKATMKTPPPTSEPVASSESPPSPKNAVSAPAPVAKPAPASEPLPHKADFPSMRLQGILYNPKNPAAIINGRTLRVGEKISGVTVTAITQDKAMVTWNGMTNVLSLPE
jgi:hypothetical protein